MAVLKYARGPCPSPFPFFLYFGRNELFENHLAKLWREALNGLCKPAAFFPAPHQSPALVWRLCHPGSGGIIADLLVSNIPHSFVVSPTAVV